MDNNSKVQTLIWDGRKLHLIDQPKLPFIKEYAICDFEKVGMAIKDMIVRGAPAIGVSAAYGAAIAGSQYEGSSKKDYKKYFEDALAYLAASRPTAVNLFWALKRMKDVFIKNEDLDISQVKKILISEAEKIESEDILINKKIGENGIEAF
ncbi:MAG: S-methyl-5-thioribose-1-phosphate isomerase, partial [Actinobacteria bacterium]|nr:S-methyl-5-thioribose-1-phosphate isomerase [Actinomycetota bacterium]